MPCIFCDIVQGRAPASIVHEDDTVIAFMALTPVTTGHTLVVPRQHHTGLADLDEQTGSLLWTVAHRVGRALPDSGLPCEGVNLYLADGEAAFQDVFHVHLHVFPRFPGDGYHLEADWRQRDRTELDDTAAALRTALAPRH